VACRVLDCSKLASRGKLKQGGVRSSYYRLFDVLKAKYPDVFAQDDDGFGPQAYKFAWNTIQVGSAAASHGVLPECRAVILTRGRPFPCVVSLLPARRARSVGGWRGRRWCRSRTA
jgi:hypothetical protein